MCITLGNNKYQPLSSSSFSSSITTPVTTATTTTTNANTTDSSAQGIYSNAKYRVGSSACLRVDYLWVLKSLRKWN